MEQAVDDDDEDDLQIVEQLSIIGRSPSTHNTSTAQLQSPSLASIATHLPGLLQWCSHGQRWLYAVHLLIVLAPSMSLLLVNAYYFHLLSLSVDFSSHVLSTIHNDLHTADVQGEGGIDSRLLHLVPANASALHVAQCGLPAERVERGLCYSVAANSSEGDAVSMRYADCASLIPVDVLQGSDIREASAAEVNLYGSPCRPLPQGHPDVRLFNPYTTRCDLPHWVLARNAQQAPPPQPQLPSSSPSQPSSSLPSLSAAEQIPRLLHQTHARATFLPPMQFWSMRSWMDRNPDYRYTFYDDEDVRVFIAGFSHPLLSSAQADDVRLAAARLRLHMPMAALADLLRYMLMLQLGGVYVDTDTACIDALSSWIDYDTDAFIIQSNMDLQWIIIAQPAHPIMLDTLLHAVHNVLHPLEAHLSISPVYETTGPPVLLAAIERYSAAVRADSSLRPIRVVESDPDASMLASLALTLHGRVFNYFQFANHLLLKSCEVEWEQRLHEHVPWVYKHRVHMATFLHTRIRTWSSVTWLLCACSALLWWVAYRGERVSKALFTCWSVALALMQAAVMLYVLPV